MIVHVATSPGRAPPRASARSFQDPGQGLERPHTPHCERIAVDPRERREPWFTRLDVNVSSGVYTRGVRWAVVAFALALGGCAGAGARPDPSGTVGRLAQALRAGDAVTIAELTGRSPEQVQGALATEARELGALGAVLDTAALEPGARVTLADGSTVMLVREGESWRVDRGVLGRSAFARPVDAIAALHAALARSRLAGVFEAYARSSRGELDAELTRWIDGTADPDALDVRVHGEAATVETPTGEIIELVRESGEWRVVELR